MSHPSRLTFGEIPQYTHRGDAYQHLELAVANEPLARAVFDLFGCANELPPKKRFRNFAGTTIVASLVETQGPVIKDTEDSIPLAAVYFTQGKVADTGKRYPIRNLFIEAMCVSREAERIGQVKGSAPATVALPVAEQLCWLMVDAIIESTNRWGSPGFDGPGKLDCRKPLSSQKPSTGVVQDFWRRMGAEEVVTNAQGEETTHNGWVYIDTLRYRLASERKRLGVAPVRGLRLPVKLP